MKPNPGLQTDSSKRTLSKTLRLCNHKEFLHNTEVKTINRTILGHNTNILVGIMLKIMMKFNPNSFKMGSKTLMWIRLITSYLIKKIIILNCFRIGNHIEWKRFQYSNNVVVFVVLCKGHGGEGGGGAWGGLELAIWICCSLPGLDQQVVRGLSSIK